MKRELKALKIGNLMIGFWGKEIPEPAKPGMKQGDYHKVCKNGHSKPYAGECQVCLYLWTEKRKKARRVKGGQK